MREFKPTLVSFWQVALRCCLWVFALGCCALTSCVPEEEPTRGELVVAVQSDMSFPKDIDEVRVQVRVAGALHRDETFSIAPNGDDHLPITLTLLDTDVPEQTVEISVVGTLEGSPRVFAKAITQIPDDRSALLQMPLQWLCDGSAVETKKGKFESTCPDAKDTCRLGQCEDPHVEQESLPDFSPKEVFGGGASPDDDEAACFDTGPCFDYAVAVVPDGDCRVDVATADTIPALGLSLPQPGDGICGEAGCYIPLDLSVSFGFSVLEQNDDVATIQLPEQVCSLLADGSVAEVSASTVCPAKTPRIPTCGLWSSVERRIEIVLPPNPPVDAGSTLDAGVPLEEDAAPLDAAVPDSGGPGGDVATDASTVSDPEEPITLIFQSPLAYVLVQPAVNELPAGVEVQLRATAVYENGASVDVTDSVEWSSDDPDVVSVSDAGLAETISPGAAQIHALLDDVSGSSSFDVTPAEVVALRVTPPSVTLPAGHSVQLVAEASFSDGTTLNVTSSAVWSTSDEEIATVDGAGRVETLAPGELVVEVSYSGLQATTDLLVTDAALLGLTVSPANASVPVGLGVNFRAQATFSDGSSLDVTTSAQWSTDEAEIATIGTNGRASTYAAGTAIVVAQFGGELGSATLDVTGAQLLDITVEPAQVAVAAGSTAGLIAWGTYSDGTTLDITADAIWTTQDYQVATVSNTGVVTAVAEGATTVFASLGGVEGSAGVDVTEAVLEQLTLSPPGATVVAGRNQQFLATAHYSDGSTQNVTALVAWSSQNVSIASINAAGLLLGVAPGTVQIGAGLDGVSVSANVTVTDAELVGLVVAPESNQLPAGMTRALTATGTFSDGSTFDLSAQVQWTSSDTDVVTVNSAGLATAVAKGSADVTAALDDQTGQATFDVTDAVLQSIAVTPTQGSVVAGYTFPFKADGTYSDGSVLDLTTAVTWVSSDVSVATVIGGVATGLIAGDADITASLGGLFDTVPLEVLPPELIGLAVEPGVVSLDIDDTEQLTAVGTYSDNTTGIVAATWESKDQAIVKLDQPGLIRGVAGGTTAVYARVGSLEAFADVTVNEPVVELVLSPVSATVQVGATTQFKATLYTDGAALDVTGAGTWTSLAPNNFDVEGGKVHAFAEGGGNLQFDYLTFTEVASVTVKGFAVKGLRIDPPKATVTVGTPLQMRAHALLEDNTERDLTTSCSWSSNVDVLNVQSGLVSASGSGSGQIKAVLGALSAVADVVARYKPQLVAEPNSISMPVGFKIQLQVSHLAQDGTKTNVTENCKYVIDEPLIVRVNGGGVVYSSNETGSTKVQAQYSGLAVDIPVTVTGPDG